ncbi:MAG: fibro-slime domain-containing protein [Lawsonibacter sp.]|nr:fibro-slime domain-containing protein [Lawsonibacter sp.]
MEMEHSFMTQASQYHASRRRRRLGHKVFTVLASVVVFCTTYALILPAITLSNTLTCGLEEHTHAEACYAMQVPAPRVELICSPQVPAGGALLHSHNHVCYDNEGNLICTLAEVDTHTHTDSCWRESRTLVCEELQEPGHTHTDACYTLHRGELICTETESQEASHTHTSACYTTVTSGLTCTQAEGGGHTHDDSCYTVETIETLTCSIPEGDGHTHSSSCYAPDREELTCSLEEGEEHSHDSSCYTTIPGDLVCGEAEEPGHSHSGACYTVEEIRTLTCSEPEESGHTHDSSCYAQEEELTCTQTEQPAGHVHSDSCYDWSQELTCHETERPEGHVHTDACYQIDWEMSCGKQELRPHTHSDSCYDEAGALTCGLPEAVVHNHTADCVYTQDVENEEVRTLLCGLEEHSHTDGCYLEVFPELGQKYLCGFSAHTHGEGCYFADGQLLCTLAEHIHTEDCLEKTEAPIADEDCFCGLVAHTHTDACSNEFLERICGLVEHTHTEACLQDPEAPIADEDCFCGFAAHTHTEACCNEYGELVCGLEEHTHTEACLEQPEQKPVELWLDNKEFDGELQAFDLKFTVSGRVELPAAETGAAAHSENLPQDLPQDLVQDSTAPLSPEQDLDPGFTLDESNTPAVTQDDIQFEMVPLTDADEAYQEVARRLDCDEEEEFIPLEVLTVTASLNGEELDLSECELMVEITPKAELLASMQETAAMYAIDPEDLENSELPEEPAVAVVALDTESVLSNSVLDAESTAESNTITVRTMASRSFGVTGLLSNVYPSYSVEFYANLDRPVHQYASDAVAKSYEKTNDGPIYFIDTSAEKNGGSAKLPDNNGRDKVNLTYFNIVNNRLETENKLTRVYLEENTHFFNPQKGLTIDDMDSLKQANNDNYALKELWVLNQPEGVEITDEYKENPDNWTVYNPPTVSFTNNPDAADESTICITEGTVFRMVYDPATKGHTNAAAFYDYDITNGVKDANGKYNAESQGINSNTTGNDGTRLAFGNQNAGTDYGTIKWGSNYPNKRNNPTWNPMGDEGTFDATKDRGYQGCTFKLVTGYADGKPVFDSELDAPNLFLGGADGKTSYGGSLNFAQQGDTFTLQSVTVDGHTRGNLDTFRHPQSYKYIWTNNFWPMDDVTGKRADPNFGAKGNTPATTKGALPESDDGGNHNAYFGMNFSVKFQLAKEYVGPLEYYFYGDDDMWVFLDGPDGIQMVCDIGGVHSSVGEYVNLWDYIPMEGRPDGYKEYTLHFFYTERGASGSTCWMQYTLPKITQVTPPVQPNPEESPLVIQKLETGLEAGNMGETEYTFYLTLSNTTSTWQANRYDASGKEIGQISLAPGAANEFKLKHGESLKVMGLTSGIGYSVREEAGANYNASVTVDGVLQSTDGTAGGAISNPEVPVQVVYTNAYYYALPATGGIGTLWYTLGGLLLLAVGALWYKKYSWGEEAAD